MNDRFFSVNDRFAARKTTPGKDPREHCPVLLLCRFYNIQPFQEMLIIKVEINVQLVPAVDIHAVDEAVHDHLLFLKRCCFIGKGTVFTLEFQLADQKTQ